MNKKIIFCLLFIVVLISGCTKTGKLFKIKDNSTVVVVENYINFLSYSNDDEEIESIEKRLPYSSGYLHQYLFERKTFLSQVKGIMEDFVLEFDDLCYDVDKKDNCDKIKGNTLEIREVRSYEVSIISIEELERNTTHSKVLVELEEIFNEELEVKKKTYYLEKIGEEWKIYDLYIESEGLISDIHPLEEVKENNTELLEDIKIYIDSGLDGLKKLKKDKCSYLNTLDLTILELEKERQDCYTNRYINYATLNEDKSICREITDPFYLGLCYSSLAVELDDLNICEDVEDIEYEAKGYYENLSSRDVCYFFYNFDTYGVEKEFVCDLIKNEQFKENCYKSY